MQELLASTSRRPSFTSVRVAPSASAIPTPRLKRARSSRQVSRRGAVADLHLQQRNSFTTASRASQKASVTPTLEDAASRRPLVKNASGRLSPARFAPLVDCSQPGHIAAVPRSAPVDVSLTVDLQRQLNALFGVCDGDDDGRLNTDELVILFELLGMTPEDAQDAVTQSQDAGCKPLVSFNMMMEMYRDQIEACSRMNPFPRNDFIMRCKRLKHGLRKADSNGDTVITKAELEIALQKLDYVVTDTDLDRIFSVLDRNGDGSIDWCEFVHAAWHNSLGSISDSMTESFSIDMLADLPSLLRPATRAVSMLGPSRLRVPISLTKTARSSASLLGTQRSTFLERRVLMARSSAKQRRHSSEPASTIERLGVEYMTHVAKKRLSMAKKTAESIGRQSQGRSMGRSQGRSVGRSQGQSSNGRSDERHNVAVASRSSQPSRSAPTLRRRQTSRTGFLPHERQQIRVIETAAVVIAAMAGVICGSLSVLLEALISTRISDAQAIYYVAVVFMNIGVSIIEVHSMYVTAIFSALRLTIATNLKLYPQDAEREFLTKSIARAALQVGLRKDKLFGIDPMKGSPRLVLWLSLLMFKSKRYVLKSLLKLLIKRVVWRAAAKSMLSLMVVPVNAVMNAWTLHRVMLNCRVNIIGPPCVAALLEAFFLHEDGLSPFQRVDCVRVIGCVVAAKRCIHPNVEIIIEHLRHQWLQKDLWPVADDCTCRDSAFDESCPRHVLDDVDLLIGSLSLYASQAQGPSAHAIRQHLQNMYFLLIVSLVIDGSVGWVERRLYNRLCHAGRMQNAWKGVLRLKKDFVAGKGIHVTAVYALVQEISDEAAEGDQQKLQRVSWRESLQYMADRAAKSLVW